MCVTAHVVCVHVGVHTPTRKREVYSQTNTQNISATLICYGIIEYVSSRLGKFHRWCWLDFILVLMAFLTVCSDFFSFNVVL